MLTCRARDGGQQARRAKENAKQPLKPLRREGRVCSARPVVPAASIFFRWRATGAASARPSLRPLFSEGGEFQHSSGASCRENEIVRLRAASRRQRRARQPQLSSRASAKRADPGSITTGFSCLARDQQPASYKHHAVWVPVFAGTTPVIWRALGPHDPNKKKGAPACAGAPQRSGHCRVFARTEVADLVAYDQVPGELSSCRRARRGR